MLMAGGAPNTLLEVMLTLYLLHVGGVEESEEQPVEWSMIACHIMLILPKTLFQLKHTHFRQGSTCINELELGYSYMRKFLSFRFGYDFRGEFASCQRTFDQICCWAWPVSPGHFDTASVDEVILTFERRTQHPICESKRDLLHSRCILMSLHSPRLPAPAPPATKTLELSSSLFLIS